MLFKLEFLTILDQFARLPLESFAVDCLTKASPFLEKWFLQTIFWTSFYGILICEQHFIYSSVVGRKLISLPTSSSEFSQSDQNRNYYDYIVWNLSACSFLHLVNQTPFSILNCIKTCILSTDTRNKHFYFIRCVTECWVVFTTVYLQVWERLHSRAWLHVHIDSMWFERAVTLTLE